MDSQNIHLHSSTASCWVHSRFLSAEGFQPGRFHGFSPSGYRWEMLIHYWANLKAAEEPSTTAPRLSNELSDVPEFPTKGVFLRRISSFELLVWVKVVFSTVPNPLLFPLQRCCSALETSLCLISWCWRFHLREPLFKAELWLMWSASAPLTFHWSRASLHHLRQSRPCIFRIRSAVFRSKNQFQQFLNLVSSIKSCSRARDGSWQASVTEQILPVNGTSPQPSVCNV